MRVIHVLRKPLSEGTVAANVLKHGCGGINIDASRVAAPGETISNHSRGDESAISKGIYGDSAGQETHQTEGQKSGRWPANVILQHLDGCRCEGVKRVKCGSFTGKKSERDALNRGHDEIYRDYGSRSVVTHADKDGKETVANWICVEGCPVRALDEQSGPAGSVVKFKQPGNINKLRDGGGDGPSVGWTGHKNAPSSYGDKGGASRFFKQVGGSKK